MRTSPLLACAGALALLACDGVIADPSATEDGAGGRRGPSVDPSDPAYCDTVDPVPGPVTLRRLNREEYNNTERFPEWDDTLRESMRRETLELVRYVVESNAPVQDLLTARYTFLNERLAQHYGVEGVTGSDMQRVELSGDERAGILTHGSVLTVTSHPDVTSPVKRGKWVLDQILCAPPPDPPPDVDTFIGGTETGESLRERLERHRADPACATCHDVMDPIGFALENYDPIGRYRTEHDGYPVDASGQLPDGRTFEGALELARVLEEDERYVECVTEKMMAYALGRGVRTADRCFVEDVVEQARARDLSLREIMVQIVTNEVFTTVGGREEVER